MSPASPNHPILDYAPANLEAEVDGGLPFARSMRRWRSICGYCRWAAVACFLIRRPIGWFALALTVAPATMTLIYMGRLAKAKVGRSYAARQVGLAIVLSFFLLFGVWLVPILVESDILKWDAIEERDEELK